jgi:3-oxoacyl-[acyl-carrier protein] reductase
VLLPPTSSLDPERNAQRDRDHGAVAPGFVRTDMTQRGRGAVDWPGTEERFAARAMMARIGEPEDIANAVVFLASPESGWITAQVLTVDGGRMDYIGHS